MNEHPSDSLPAYVLGALEADEALGVAEHLRHCPTCRAEAATFQEIVGLIPHSVASEPPPHVKRQLFARIAASQGAVPAAGPARPPPRPARRQPVGLMRLATALSLALALTFGGMTLDARARLAEQEQQTSTLKQQLASFLAAPNTVTRSIAPELPGVNARMFMQPGHNRVVLVVHGLPTLEIGQTYQFWLADSQGAVPSQTFTVGQDGAVELVIDAPSPVDAYAEVMVTVEQRGGSQSPTGRVVLQASL